MSPIISRRRLALVKLFAAPQHERADADLSTVTAAALALATGGGRRPRRPAAQPGGGRWTARRCIATRYRVEPEHHLPVGGGWNGKLDLYVPRRPNGVLPTAVLFHGGGWVTGQQGRDRARRAALPGDGVRGRQRRLSARARRAGAGRRPGQPLRAALGGPPCAAVRVRSGALVLVGSSAGAHLALMAALAPASAGFDGLCPGNEPLTRRGGRQLLRRRRRRRAARAAAPARLRGRLDGHRRRTRRRAPRASRRSTTSRKGAPAVLTLHGDADPVVPFTQATPPARGAGRASARPTGWCRSTAAGTATSTATRCLHATHVVHDFLLKRGLITDRPIRAASRAQSRVD